MRWTLCALLIFTACGTTGPASVPVTVSLDDVRQLAGNWRGFYEGTSTGRHGSIVFALEASNGTAHGDVIMVAEDRNSYAGPSQALEQRPRNMLLAQPLSIQFVVISGNEISGMLDPYEDPNCHCILSTTFVGRVDGNRIKGNFITWGAGTAGPQRGTWSVRRTQ